MIKRVPYGTRGIIVGLGAASVLVIGCSLALDFDESKITEGQPSADASIDTTPPDTAPPPDTATPDTATPDTSTPEVSGETTAETSDDTLVDTGADTGVIDTGLIDTGVIDTGVIDTGSVDTGVIDTGVLDTGVLDTGVLDTGTPDTGTPDTGTPDTGVVDTGELDTGVDTSVLDTGTDTGVVDVGVDAGFTPSSFGGCTASDYTTNDRTDVAASRTITFPTAAYSPNCMRVKIGQVVTWNGVFADHPLRHATSNNPAGGAIPDVGASPDPGTATATFTVAGHYGYYCLFHGANDGTGMAGTIEVVP